MKWLNCNGMRMMLVGVAAVILLVGGRAKADFTFGEPTNLQLAGNDPYNHGGAITSDNLEQYFNTMESAWDIWVTTRTTPEDTWTEPVRLDAPINTQYTEAIGCVSSDDLELYFISDRPGGSGREDIWVTRRESMQDSWGSPVNLGSVINSSGHDDCWSISDDGLELYFFSTRSGGFGRDDLYVARRVTKDDPWQKPINLSASVNSSTADCFPLILREGLMLWFSDHPEGNSRLGGYGGGDIWMTTRATRNDDWNVPINLGPKINSTAYEGTPKISPDGSILYFLSDRPGGSGETWADTYQAPIIPIVDLNGDGIVDSADMCIMVDHWGEDYSLCDIGPMPWGDGIVDVQDLIVLAKHLFEEPGLIAYWMLDETEGDIAYDSVGGYNGTLVGDPTWQTDTGMIAGALEFDGIDDHISTDTIQNPADGALSVLVWIKGGAPGQVFVSQTDGANWLLADPSEGCLMTELKGIGRMGKSLLSKVCITDDTWHRIGFVWDGANRSLYVDDILVSEDTQNILSRSLGGLNIGCGSNCAEGTFFSGLIDDIRIYNRVVSP